MSTIKTTHLQHPSASSPNLTLAADGSVSLQTGAWIDYTPVIDQGGAVTASTLSGVYLNLGSIVFVNIYAQISSSGSAGTIVTVTLPVTSSRVNRVIGSGTIFDASASTQYSGSAFLQTSGTASLIGDWSAGSRWGSSPSIGLTSGDIIRLQLVYEA